MCMSDGCGLSIFHMVIILYSENCRDEFKKKNKKIIDATRVYVENNIKLYIVQSHCKCRERRIEIERF